MEGVVAILQLLERRIRDRVRDKPETARADKASEYWWMIRR